ncbi:hypothetical protein SAMN05444159_6999 [Bradyrhizobium lablabi]|uniref:Uncharacterized protein n=1 Tax=Bradyrhizobium lablabi TaxID=722472 RepID=A0A1M7E145_9BRAD|nr:hypothetical protein [Bradyrhizobium lablabi]SHL85475.1 hypothetical protein SAMN05444159_6999 [Bradyrhizobium lablabi]
MNWAWASSLDHIWRSPTFPMWLTLAAAGFFGIIVLITLLRAEKSVANGALTVITLLAIGIAAAATIRGFGPFDRTASSEPPSSRQASIALPALSCIDDIAGETVLTACEKALFGAPETAAAALSYAASQITRLTALGDVTTANKSMTPELQMVRRAIERDRYGLMAYVLAARDHCTAADCAAFRALTDYHQIVVNMDERTYEGLIARYAPSWNAPPPTAAAPVAALAPTMPTGKPTNAEFPSAASTPPVSIMTPEPGTAPAPRAAAAAPAANAPLPSPRPPASALASAKKPAAAKPARSAAAPVQIAPTAPAPAASAPAASND